MTGKVVAFRDLMPTDEREALTTALVSLRTLITIDPILGASPVRVHFVLNPQAKSRIAECIDPDNRIQGRSAHAFALVAYDFPFALHSIEGNAPHISHERAKEIAMLSAGLQGESLQAAAKASGIAAQPIPAFDADGLKTIFFPSTQETVIHLFRLAPPKGRLGGPSL